jgi:hypothetical protein
VQRFGFRVPVNDEKVATNSAAHRLDQSHHRAGGDGCVGCVSAGLQNVQSNLSRQRMTRRDHPVCRDDDGTALSRITDRSIEPGSLNRLF